MPFNGSEDVGGYEAEMENPPQNPSAQMTQATYASQDQESIPQGYPATLVGGGYYPSQQVPQPTYHESQSPSMPNAGYPGYQPPLAPSLFPHQATQPQALSCSSTYFSHPAPHTPHGATENYSLDPNDLQLQSLSLTNDFTQYEPYNDYQQAANDEETYLQLGGYPSSNALLPQAGISSTYHEPDYDNDQTHNDNLDYYEDYNICYGNSEQDQHHLTSTEPEYPYHMVHPAQDTTQSHIDDHSATSGYSTEAVLSPFQSLTGDHNSAHYDLSAEYQQEVTPNAPGAMHSDSSSSAYQPQQSPLGNHTWTGQPYQDLTMVQQDNKMLPPMAGSYKRRQRGPSSSEHSSSQARIPTIDQSGQEQPTSNQMSTSRSFFQAPQDRPESHHFQDGVNAIKREVSSAINHTGIQITNAVHSAFLQTQREQGHSTHSRQPLRQHTPDSGRFSPQEASATSTGGKTVHFATPVATTEYHSRSDANHSSARAVEPRHANESSHRRASSGGFGRQVAGGVKLVEEFEIHHRR